MPDGERPARATVLIADDAVHIRRLCAMLLESHGFAVIEAGSRSEVTDLYRHHRPDLVLLDIGMPGGGLEALSEIKGIDANARVAMLTGRHDALTVKAALATGARDYVVKPFTRQRLMTAVARLLDD